MHSRALHSALNAAVFELFRAVDVSCCRDNFTMKPQTVQVLGCHVDRHYTVVQKKRANFGGL